MLNHVVESLQAMTIPVVGCKMTLCTLSTSHLFAFFILRKVWNLKMKDPKSR